MSYADQKSGEMPLSDWWPSWAVCKFFGITEMGLYRRMKNDGGNFPDFPKPRKVGRLNYWYAPDIKSWDASQKEMVNE